MVSASHLDGIALQRKNELFIQRIADVAVPRTEAENERVRQEARARVLAGARKAFAREGLAATMADIAAAAGVSQGLPYRYFSDKDDLVRALVTEAIQQTDAEGPPLALPSSAAQRLHGMVTTMIEARRTRPELFLLLHHVMNDPATPRDLLKVIQSRADAAAEAMLRLIAEAQTAGEAAADDPYQLVIAIRACLDGLSRFALSYPDQAAAHFPAAEIITRMLAPPHPRSGRPSRPGGAVPQDGAR
jgi:AcrR family transcriptional regulator